MSIDSQNIQWPSGSAYLVADRGTGAYGVKDIQSAIPPVILASQDFETDPIPGTGGGDLPWLTTVSSPHSGLRCFRSGAIGNNQQSLWTFTNPVGAINLIGWYRVSSEAGFDFLEIYKDSVTVPNRVLQQSGTGNVWIQFTVNVTGATSIILRYVKDGSASSGLDTVFIDDLEWQTASQAAINNWEPFHLNNNNCVKVVLCDNTVAITGTVDITPLDCMTDSITVCPPVSGFDVNVNNFPAVAHLDCVTDSVTICPGEDPIPVTLDEPIDVNVISSVEIEIKNDSGNPVPVSFSRLSCVTDSVEICNDAGSPISVSGTVTVDTNFDYPEDSHHTSGEVGAFVLAVRNDDPLNPLTDANFDYSPIAVTNTGRVFTTDRGNFAEDTPHTSGHFGEFVLGVRNDAAVVLTDTNLDYSPLATDSAGRIGITDLGGSLTVDGTVAVSNQNTQYAEDTSAVSGDLGNGALVMRHDANTSTVSADGDYSLMHVNAFGQLKVDIGNQTINAVPGKRSLLGLYYATSGPIVYTTAADAANGGDVWLVNTSSTVVVYLRSVRFTALLDSLAILTNLPTIRMERMTFTGTPSGTLVTPAKRDSNDAANTGTVRTAATGMTITAGAAIESFSPPTADVIGGLLAVNATASIPVEQLFVGDLDSFIALRQNEGIVLRQNTAGNATENRQYWVNFVWEEI